MYLTYDEYEEFGGTLDETAFAQYEFEARTLIDWWTFSRLQNEQSFPEAVKRCVYALISFVDTKNKAMVVDSQTSSNETVQAGIVSESNDGVSTTYNTLTAKEAVDTMKQEAEKTIQMYLQGVRNSLGQLVLYRGLYPNE